MVNWYPDAECYVLVIPGHIKPFIMVKQLGGAYANNESSAIETVNFPVSEIETAPEEVVRKDYMPHG